MIESCRFEPFLEGKTSVIRGIIDDGKELNCGTGLSISE